MRGVSRQAVDKRVQDGSLLAVPGPSNRRSYPTLQFNRDGTVVPGLKAVREVLRTRNSWTRLNFLSHPDARLGNRKPIELLKSGQLDLVLEAARRHGEQGRERATSSRRLGQATARAGELPAGQEVHRFYTAKWEPIFCGLIPDK